MSRDIILGQMPFRPLVEFRPDEERDFTELYAGRKHADVLVKEITCLFMGPMTMLSYRLGDFNQFVVKPAKILVDPQNEVANFVPEVEFVWGENQRGIQRGFILNQKVRGLDLTELDKLSPTATVHLDRLIAACVVIANKTNGRIMPDIWDVDNSLCNITVGTIKQRTNPLPWLTDVYPLVTLPHQNQYNMLATMDNTSKKFGFDFPLAREAIEKGKAWY